MHQEATETYRQRHSQLLYDAILYYDALALRCPMTLRPLYFFFMLIMIIAITIASSILTLTGLY